jgi:thiol-disulfide isomerase/thioredoxin
MKKILAGVLLLTAMNSAAQNREIIFAHSDVPAVMAKAKAEKKLVFVDCYTEWCVPCKFMSNKVFTQDSVADFFNTNFINLKMDMEKGEGPAMLKQYTVGAFPTFLLLDSDGKLVYKFVGGMEAGPFLEKVREGMNPANRIASMMKRYNEGDRSHELMRDYIWESLKMMEKKRAQELEHEYFTMLTPKQRAAKENWFMFGENNYSRELSDMHSENFNYLVEHWRDFAAVQGKKVVDEKISGVFRKLTGYTFRGWYQKSIPYEKADFDRYRKQIKGTQVPDKKDLLVMMDMAQAACEKDSAKVLNLMADNIAKFDSKNMDITFDFLSFYPNYRAKTIPRWKSIIETVAEHSQNPNLVRHAKSLL